MIFHFFFFLVHFLLRLYSRWLLLLSLVRISVNRQCTTNERRCHRKKGRKAKSPSRVDVRARFTLSEVVTITPETVFRVYRVAPSADRFIHKETNDSLFLSLSLSHSRTHLSISFTLYAISNDIEYKLPF